MLGLYGLPPEQFTAARNELSKALRDAGDTDGSASVRTLRKPTLAAWWANRLVRIAPDQVAELTEFGDELRAAHQSANRDRLRRLTPSRRPRPRPGESARDRTSERVGKRIATHFEYRDSQVKAGPDGHRSPRRDGDAPPWPSGDVADLARPGRR